MAEWKHLKVDLTYPIEHPETKVTVPSLSFHEPSVEELELMEEGSKDRGNISSSIVMMETLLDDQALVPVIRKMHRSDWEQISAKLAPFVQGSSPN